VRRADQLAPHVPHVGPALIVDLTFMVPAFM
jgi:hypothetical protein